MRRRKGGHEEHENLERWLVSYADFITLLFAFFVVMYSISSVNEGKYRVLSETLNAVFTDNVKNPLVEKALDPVQIGQPKRSDAQESSLLPPNESRPEPIDMKGKNDGKADERQKLAEAAVAIERVLAPFIQDELIEVKRHDDWVEIEMKSGLLFSSGSAQVSLTAIPMLEKLADIFNAAPNPINVEGHTDDRPINTRDFPSNWELSAARAASVVHQLMRAGVDGRRMAAIGYGENHPIAENATEAGRDKNRRVVLVLQSREAARYQAGDDKPPPAPAPPATSGQPPPEPAPVKRQTPGPIVPR